MKTREEIASFESRARSRMMQCKICEGLALGCECRKRFAHETRCYEACIPESFWWFDRKQVTHNIEVFDDLIIPYLQQFPTAHRLGAGLFLYGANGCGKSCFLSYIGQRVARSNRFTVYYTTMPKLASDIGKTWNDKTGEAAARLAYYQSSDLVIIDELGKERSKAGDHFARVELERWVKERFDKLMPTLWASNLSPEDLGKDPENGGYGETVMSVIEGRCKVVPMEPGDFRKGKLRESIGSAMGWE